MLTQVDNQIVIETLKRCTNDSKERDTQPDLLNPCGHGAGTSSVVDMPLFALRHVMQSTAKPLFAMMRGAHPTPTGSLAAQAGSA